MNFLKKIFHRHVWHTIDYTPVDRTRYHCVMECQKCKKRKSQIIDIG